MALNWEKFLGSFQPGKNHPDIPPLRDTDCFMFTNKNSRKESSRAIPRQTNIDKYQSPKANICFGCDDTKCSIIVCKYKEKCSRYKRVQKYLLDKSNSVSTADMQHCNKFTHVKHAKCNQWCCGENCKDDIKYSHCNWENCDGNCGMYHGTD